MKGTGLERTPGCCSAHRLDADRRCNVLIRFDSEESNDEAEHLCTPPVDASVSSNGSVHAVRCLHLFGLLMRRTRLAPLACMEMRGSGPYQHCELEGSLFGSWLSRPRLVDRFALARPPSCPHPRRRPAPRPLRRRREPGSSPSSSPVPRRYAPFGWPEPPRPASSACAPASWPARDPPSRRAGPRAGQRSWRL